MEQIIAIPVIKPVTKQISNATMHYRGLLRSLETHQRRRDIFEVNRMRGLINLKRETLRWSK